MRNAVAAMAPYEESAQLARARRDALVAAAQAAIVWARAQSRVRADLAALTPTPVEEPAASSFSMTPLIDVARSAGDAGITAARGARSATRVVVNGLATVGSGVSRFGVPILRAL